MNTKSIFLSKTFWLQVVAVAAMMFPQVQAWLKENPVEIVGVFAALNVLVRFATSGKINLFGAGESSGATPLILLVTTLGVLTALPSCTGSGEYPLTGSLYLRDPSSGAKAGLTFAPGMTPQASIKVPVYDQTTGDLIGMADLSTTPQAVVVPEK